MLNASVAAGSDFDSTQFAGDMDLTSANIKTARLGAGDDTAVIDGQANLATSSYNLGEGDNTATFNVALGGNVTSGEGDDAVTVNGSVSRTSAISLNGGDNDFTATGQFDGTFTSGSGSDDVSVASTGVGSSPVFRSSINVGDGENTVSVTGAHAGDIIGGSDADTVSAGTTSAGSTIAVGNGTNSVDVTGAHAGSITGGSNSDTVNAGSTAATGSINLGDGTNGVFLSGTHAGAIVGGQDSDTISASATLAGSTIALGDGENAITLTGDHAGSIIGGSDADTVEVGSVTGGEISTAAGTDTVTVNGNVINASIDLGDGDGNVLTVNGTISRSTPPTSITFGDGNLNRLDVTGNILNEAVEFGTGSNNTVDIGGFLVESSIDFSGETNNVLIGEDVVDSDITFGNGENIAQVGGSVSAGSNVTFGDGADQLTIGDFVTDSPLVFSSGGEDIPELMSAAIGEDFTPDTATVILMGDGNDQVTLQNGDTPYLISGFSALNGSAPYLVESGGFIDGEGGSDDTFTAVTDQDANVDVIGRTELQKVEIELFKPDVSSYRPGDVITVSFDGVIAPVTYTVVEADIVQGNGAATSENIAVGVAAALNADASFQALFSAAAIDGTAATGGTQTTSVYIISDNPLEDVTISASHGVFDEGLGEVATSNPIEATVMQISDTRVTGFENVELVIRDNEFDRSSNDFNAFDFGEPDFADVPNSEAVATSVVRADFDLIELEGAKNILLDSQVSLDSTVVSTAE